MHKTIKIDHLARVEGHGGINVFLDGTDIKGIQFDIYEGARLIEALIAGRGFEDIPQITSRICAICSVAHSITSIKAIENAFGVKVSEQTTILRDLLFRGENIESHPLHLFLLALPDYLGYPSAIALANDNPEAVSLGLRLKKLGNTIQEILGGRAVHPVNAVIGGFGKLPTFDQLIILRRELQQGMNDCDKMTELLANLPPQDLCHTETLFAALESIGDYGYYFGDEIKLSDNEKIPVANYRLLTNERTVSHSTAKHSQYNGKPFMVGALARLTINRHKLTGRALSAMDKLELKLPSDNPMDNNIAQAVELVFDVEHALQTVERLLREGLKEEKPAEIHPIAGTGIAATEAPRGTLYHSYSFDSDGKLIAADVITPTAQNLACAESHFRTTITQSSDKSIPTLTKKLEMIARSYDPCISCSVHLIQR